MRFFRSPSSRTWPRSRPGRCPEGGLELILQPGARRVAIRAGDARRSGRTGAPSALAPADRVVQAGDQYLSTRVLSVSPARDLQHQLERPERRPDRRGQSAGRAAARAREGPRRRSRGHGRANARSVAGNRPDPLGRRGARLLAPRAQPGPAGRRLLDGRSASTSWAARSRRASPAPDRRATATSASTDRGPVCGGRIPGSPSFAWATGSPAARGRGRCAGSRSPTSRSSVPHSSATSPSRVASGPGWQIEAYRGGRLLAIDSANALGRFSLDVPVEYGENPVDFIAYGPFGEVRQFNQTYRVVSDVIPARRFEYGASLGGCRSAICRANGNIDVRYGLSPRWTVRGGMDQFWRDTLPALSHPYVGVAGAIGNAWALEFEGVAAAVVRGAARYEPSREPPGQHRIQPLRHRPGAADSHAGWAGGRSGPRTPWRGRSADGTTSTSRRASTGSPRRPATTPAAGSGCRCTPPVFVWRRRSGSPAFTPRHPASPAASRSCRSTPSPFRSPSWVRCSGGSPGARRGKSTTAAARPRWRRISRGSSATPSMSRPGRAGIAARGTTLSLFLSTQLPSVRATTSITAPLHGPAVANQFVQGSLLYDPANRRMAFASGPSLERAGVSGRVFLDENGDGRWQAGEELLPDVRVLGRLHLGAVGLRRPVPGVGSSGIRAGARDDRLLVSRLAALGARLRLRQR